MLIERSWHGMRTWGKADTLAVQWIFLGGGSFGGTPHLDLPWKTQSIDRDVRRDLDRKIVMQCCAAV